MSEVLKHDGAKKEIPRVYRALPEWFKKDLWDYLPEEARPKTKDLAYQMAAIIQFGLFIQSQLNLKVSTNENQH